MMKKERIKERGIEMTIKEAADSGKEFKLEGAERWLYAYNESGTICYSGTVLPAKFSREDILSDKWIVKKAWFEGDFEKKYPQGVFCRVTNFENSKWYPAIVLGYTLLNDPEYPFETASGEWKWAKPIPKGEELPHVLAEEE